MKKLLVLAIVAASFASCSNGEGDKKVEEVKTDSSATTTTPMMTDTTKHDSTATVKVDTTTTVKKDSTKK